MGFATFGPGGNSKSFYDEGFKSTLDAPRWIKDRGLDAYEYQAGNGLVASVETLSKIGAKAKENGILMSIHAPYFISLSGIETEKRLKSIHYIRQSVNAASALGADTVVIHTGSAAKITREEAMKLAADTLYRTLDEIEDTGVYLGLETMGKINQLGTLEEVVELCKISERLSPVVDFGHLNARNRGGYFEGVDNYRRVFDYIANELGDQKANNLHCHFSQIEYTGAGEKKHLTFADTTFGPFFEPLAEAIAAEKVTPRIICESDGTMAEDALTMKNQYLEALKKY